MKELPNNKKKRIKWRKKNDDESVWLLGQSTRSVRFRYWPHRAASSPFSRDAIGVVLSACAHVLSLSLVYFWHWPPHIAPMCEYRTACAQISLTRIFKYIKRCEREREKKGRNSPFMHYGWTITTGIRNKKPVIHEARIKRLQNTSSRTSRPKEFPLCVYRRRVFCVCAKHKAASSFPPIKHQKMGYDHILLTARDIGCILTEEPASRGSLPIDRAPPPCRIAQEISKDL